MDDMDPVPPNDAQRDTPVLIRGLPLTGEPESIVSSCRDTGAIVPSLGRPPAQHTTPLPTAPRGNLFFLGTANTPLCFSPPALVGAEQGKRRHGPVSQEPGKKPGCLPAQGGRPGREAADWAGWVSSEESFISWHCWPVEASGAPSNHCQDSDGRQQA